MNEHNTTFKKGYKQGKIDAVREMQERLHEKTVVETLGETGNYKMIRRYVMLGDIDQIAKERLEDTE